MANPKIETQTEVKTDTETDTQIENTASEDNSPEKFSDNYFEQVNHEFQTELLKGNVGKEAIDEIKARNEKDFFSKIVDALKNPDEAFKWLGKGILASFAGSWLGDMFGLSDAIKKAKEGVMEVISNPFNILTGILGGFAGFKALKGIASLLSSPGKAGIGMIKKTFSGLRFATGMGLRVAALGTMGYAAIKLYEYFTDNEQEALGMPDDKNSQREWWKDKIEKSGLKDELKEEEIVPLMALVMGEEKAEEMFKDLKEEDEKAEGVGEETEGSIDTEVKVVNHPTYGIMKPVDKVIKEKTTEMWDALGRLKATLEKNKYKVAGITFVAGQIIDLKELLKTGAGLTAELLVGLAKLPLNIASGTMNHPTTSIFSTLAFLYLLKESQETYIPEDPEKFALFMKDIIDNKFEWIKSEGEETKKKIEDNIIESKNKLLEHGLTITNTTIDKVSGYICGGVEKIKEFSNDFVSQSIKILDSAIDMAAISPEEYTYQVNNEYLKTFFNDLREEENNKDYNDLLKAIVEFKEDYKETNEFDEEKYKNMKDIAILSNILIERKDGYLEWTFVDDSFVSDGDFHQFMIDPTVGDIESRKDKAKKMSYGKDFGEAFEKVAQNQLLEIRETIFGLKSAIEKGNAVICIERGSMYFIDAALEKHFIAPARLGMEVWEQVFQDKEFNATTLAVSYFDALIPITILSTITGTGNAVKELITGGTWKGAGKIFGSGVFKGVTAPVKPFIFVGKQGLRYGKHAGISAVKSIVGVKIDGTSLVNLVAHDKEALLETLRKKGRALQDIKDGILEKFSLGDRAIARSNKRAYLKEIGEARQRKLLLLEIGITGNDTKAREIFERISKTGTNQKQLKYYEGYSTNTGINITGVRDDLNVLLAHEDKIIAENTEKYKNPRIDININKLKDSKKLLEKYKTETDNKKKEKLKKEITKSLKNAGPEAKKILNSDPFSDPDKAIKKINESVSKTNPDVIATQDTELDTPKDSKSEPTKDSTTETKNSSPDGKESKDKASQKKAPDETAIKNAEFDKLPEEEKVKKILDIDTKLVESLDEFDRKKTKLENLYKKRGIKPETQNTYLKFIRENKRKIERIQIRRKRLTYRTQKAHPKLNFEQNKIQLDPQIHGKIPEKINKNHVSEGSLIRNLETGKIRIPEHLRKAGNLIKNNKMIAATILITAASLLISSSASAAEKDVDYSFYEKKDDNIDWDNLDEEEGNDPEFDEMIKEAELETQNEDQKQQMEPLSEEDERMLKDVQMKEMQVETQKLNEKYSSYFEKIFSQEYLPELSASGVIDSISLEKVERKLQLAVNQFANEYENDSAKFMMMMIDKEEYINGYFKDNPEAKKDGWQILNSLLKIKWDDSAQKAYLSYGSRAEFVEFSYGIADAFTKNEFKNFSGKDGLNATVEIAGNFIPFFGSGRDVFRAYKNLAQRGNYEQGLWDLGFGVGGLALDIGTLGTGTAAKSVLKGLRVGMDLTPIMSGVWDIEKKASGWLSSKEDTVIFEQKYYADKAEDSKPIPFSHPPIIGMTKAREISQNTQKGKLELQELFVSIKNYYYWRACIWEIQDENTVTLKRLQSDNETVIKRQTDGTWNLEGQLAASTGYSIQQAFVMANLSNSTMEWLDKQNKSGANEAPFYVSSGGDIEFDEDWTPQPVNYLSSDNEWLDAYKRSFGIEKDWIINLLNRTYKKHSQTGSINGKISELKERFNKR